MAAKMGCKRDGQTKEPEYWCWVRMRRRCFQPTHKSYKDYGGRGITVCAEWKDDYHAFLACMGRKPSPKHSVDRIDNNGNYEPGNVRWATGVEQRNNRRNVRPITFKGRTQSATAWGREIGMGRVSLERRLKVLPIEKAMDPTVSLTRAEFASLQMQRS